MSGTMAKEPNYSLDQDTHQTTLIPMIHPPTLLEHVYYKEQKHYKMVPED